MDDSSADSTTGDRTAGEALDRAAAADRHGVVAVVVRMGRLLVIRRSRHVVAPGAYCFPGGGVEPGETEPEALIREMREELCAAVRPVRRVWRSRTTWGVTLSWWLAELAADAQPACQPAEVESLAWCTPDEMGRLPNLLESNRLFLAALAAGEIELDRPRG